MAKPRSYSAKGLATFCKGRTKRIRELLAEVASTYSEVDGYIETKAEELIASMDELGRDIDDALIEGRDLS